MVNHCFRFGARKPVFRARPVGQPVTLPTQLQTPNISLIWAEVQYAYTPNLGYVMTGTLNLSDQVYMYPRLANYVTRCNC